MNTPEEERYQITKVRNGLWRLETQSGVISEHSTEAGAAKAFLRLIPKEESTEAWVNVPENIREQVRDENNLITI